MFFEFCVYFFIYRLNISDKKIFLFIFVKTDMYFFQTFLNFMKKELYSFLKMFHWLIIAYPTNIKEKKICLTTLDKINLQPGCICFVFIFGPNVNSSIQILKIDMNGIHELGNFAINTRHQNKYKKYDTIFSDIITKFKKDNVQIHGVLYYGHSSGIILGLWKGQKILTTVSRFVKKILIPLQPTILIFDSCYMGTISALFELSIVKSLRFVLASPFYHPGFSVLQTISFGKIENAQEKLLQTILSCITLEFQNLKKPRYSCFLLFEMIYIPKLVEIVIVAIQKNQLIFDANSVVNKVEDLYDLYTSAQNSLLKKQIQKISILSRKVNKCHKVRGVTIDIALPSSHLHVYQKMLWFQKVKDIMYK